MGQDYVYVSWFNFGIISWKKNGESFDEGGVLTLFLIQLCPFIVDIIKTDQTWERLLLVFHLN